MLSKFAPKRKNSVISKSEIEEELRLIEETDDYYITPSGQIYR